MRTGGVRTAEHETGSVAAVFVLFPLEWLLAGPTTDMVDLGLVGGPVFSLFLAPDDSTLVARKFLRELITSHGFSASKLPRGQSSTLLFQHTPMHEERCNTN